MKTKPFNLQEAIEHPERVVDLCNPDAVAEDIDYVDDLVYGVKVFWSNGNDTITETYTRDGRFYDDGRKPDLALKIVAEPKNGHPWAESMRLYAEDATETDEPWTRWEIRHEDGEWRDLVSHPTWVKFAEYRRKPKPRPEIEIGHEYKTPNGTAKVLTTEATSLISRMACILLVTDRDGDQYIAECDKHGRLSDGEQFVEVEVQQ